MLEDRTVSRCRRCECVGLTIEPGLQPVGPPENDRFLPGYCNERGAPRLHSLLPVIPAARRRVWLAHSGLQTL